MQAVGDFDENDAHVVAHGEQKLLERLGLERGFVAEDAAGNLGESLDDIGYFRAKEICDVFVGIFRVLLYVVEESGADGGAAESDFLADDLGNGDGMQDVGLTGEPAHALVCLFGKIESLGDDVHLAAVVGGQVGVD